MNVVRQKTGPGYPGSTSPPAGKGEAPRAPGEGTETFTATSQHESPADTDRLMEEVCERENCTQALTRVTDNKDSSGIDGMTVEDLGDREGCATGERQAHARAHSRVPHDRSHGKRLGERD